MQAKISYINNTDEPRSGNNPGTDLRSVYQLTKQENSFPWEDQIRQNLISVNHFYIKDNCLAKKRTCTRNLAAYSPRPDVLFFVLLNLPSLKFRILAQLMLLAGKCIILKLTFKTIPSINFLVQINL